MCSSLPRSELKASHLLFQTPNVGLLRLPPEALIGNNSLEVELGRMR